MDSLGSIFTDILAPALENNVWYDIEQVVRKFDGQIYRIRDQILSDLLLHAQERYDIAHQKKRCFQVSDMPQHNQMP